MTFNEKWLLAILVKGMVSVILSRYSKETISVFSSISACRDSKGTVSVISSISTCRDSNARFTVVPSNALFDQRVII